MGTLCTALVISLATETLDDRPGRFDRAHTYRAFDRRVEFDDLEFGWFFTLMLLFIKFFPSVSLTEIKENLVEAPRRSA